MKINANKSQTRKSHRFLFVFLSFFLCFLCVIVLGFFPQITRFVLWEDSYVPTYCKRETTSDKIRELRILSYKR